MGLDGNIRPPGDTRSGDGLGGPLRIPLLTKVASGATGNRSGPAVLVFVRQWLTVARAPAQQTQEKRFMKSLAPISQLASAVVVARQALAALALASLAVSASAMPVQLAADLPINGDLLGEQSDAAVLPADRPTASFVSVAAAITSVQWWGYDLAGLGGLNQFFVRVNGNALTGTLTVLASPPEIIPGVDVLRYTLDLGTAFNVGAGSKTLTVLNDSDQVEWYWQSSAVGATPLMSLRVLGLAAASAPVSEPGAMALVAAALLALRLGSRNRAA